MNDKKRIMFIAEEDYYYITMKIISVLIALECEKAPLKDFRKLPLIIELLRDELNIKVIEQKKYSDELTIFDHERLVSIYCNANSNIALVKRVIFFLEKKGFVSLSQDSKHFTINVLYTRKGKDFFEDVVPDMDDEIEKIKRIRKNYRSIRYTSYDTLTRNVIGEVRTWEN